MAKKMKESERLEKVRQEVLTNVSLENAIQVDTGSYLVETELGFGEIRIVSKKSAFDKAQAQEMVDNWEKTVADRLAKAEKAKADKADKLAKDKAKKAEKEG